MRRILFLLIFLPLAATAIDLSEIHGRLRMVDTIECGETDKRFLEHPKGISRVETILGWPCRVLKKTEGECAYFSYRIGEGKGLKAGGRYVIALDYPEDKPRTVIVLHGGNGMVRGFHTGNTFGDALHPKYVNNNNESLDVPLSGAYETWNVQFTLHDRFTDHAFVRGDGKRPLLPKDGYWITIAQFSKRNIPASHGAAVSRIRLYEVLEPKVVEIPKLPDGLPQRHVFWREEMADGAVGGKKPEDRGVADPIDWFRYKADVMKSLCINTYSKDLLEFGACQHWNSEAGGGHDWVYYNPTVKDVWSQLVAYMGKEGFNILPYYEYAGSKGKHGLGFQRRCKPLTRDDAYTHIKWIESANADITDPSTYKDFKKMLDFTIIRHKDKANFVGAWLRPRSQLPISFADATLRRFNTATGKRATRKELIRDKDLLAQYCDWWFGKRRDFLSAMRNHLRFNGVNPDAVILFTANASEPGNSFPTWDPYLVVDGSPDLRKTLQTPPYKPKKGFKFLSIQDVVKRGLYRDALLEFPKTWGKWEVHHANPPADPQRYKKTNGVLMTHCINRAYTVADPKTFDLFRGPAGLAVVRHQTLNENMMFDKKDKPKLGYFICDIERAGPYSMLAEVRAMANGDPRFIGYLVGSTFNRGFPQYVRDFNREFLSLPALPSKILPKACKDNAIVVREIATPKNGRYYAIVNTALTPKTVQIYLPGKQLRLSFHPCQVRAIHLP